jgi:hypothetical protein
MRIDPRFDDAPYLIDPTNCSSGEDDAERAVRAGLAVIEATAHLDAL